MSARIVIFLSLMLAVSHYLHAGDPGWLRHDSAKAAALADFVVVAKIRDVSVLSGKTGRPLKKYPEWVDERYRGERLRLTLEHSRILWPVGGSIPDELTISWDGVTTSFVSAYKGSTVVLLLTKPIAAKATTYTTPDYWPFADTADLHTIESVISARAVRAKRE